MRFLFALWLCFAPILAQAAAPVPVLFSAQPYIEDQLSAFPAVFFSVRQGTSGQYNPSYDWLVRRSSDNAQTQIGFVGGLLNTTALASFCAGTNAYMVTWKDAGSLGSSADATQSTAANQPQVCASGVVETQNGVPTIFFGNTGSPATIYLETAAFTAFSSGVYANIVGKIAQNTAFSTFESKTSFNKPAPIDAYNSSFLVGNGSMLTTYTLSTYISSTSGLSIWGFGASSSSAVAYYNGNQNMSPATPSYYADNNNSIMLGTRGDLTTSLNGYISEDIWFAVGNLSASDHELLETNEATFFAIPGVTQ